MPIINLSMNEVAALNGGKLPEKGSYLKKTAVENAKARLGLDTHSVAYIPASNVLRNGEEYVLKITKASLDKMFSPSDGGAVPVETVAVVENLERIANNGVYFKSEGDRKGRDQILGVDHLMTTVYIDKVPYIVDMRVRVVQSGQSADQQNVLYYFTPEEIMTIQKADGDTPAAGRPASDGGAPPSTGPIIPPGMQSINPEFGPDGMILHAGQGESIDSLIERTYNETEPDHSEALEVPEAISSVEQALIDTEWNGGERMPGDVESEVADILRRCAKSVAAKGKVVGFEQLPEGTRRDFRAGLSKAAAEAKEVLRQSYRKTDYIVRQGQKSYYRNLSNTVELGQDAPPSTLAHELFHQLDRGGVISKQFVSALAQDHVALNVVSGGDIKAYLMEKYPEAFLRHKVSGKSRLMEQYRGIADIINGLTAGKINLGYYHSDNYWAQAGTLETEAWAQLGRILYENDAEVIKMLSELFPNLMESAIMALKGLI